MKNILSINTVGNGTQISLQKGNEVFYCDVPFAKHSETLFDSIENILDTNKVSLGELNCLGVVVGPGSFTGIRIGLSVIKTFAYVHNLPIVAVNSLEVLAYNIFDKQNDAKKVCAVMNAGANQVYYQVFDVDKNCLTYNTMPRVDTVEHFKEYLKTLNNACVFSPDKLDLKGIQTTQFKATSLYKAIIHHCNKGDFCENAQVQPLYLRLAQVEVCKVNLQEMDMPLAKESESIALCGLDDQKDEFYAPWNVYDWQKNLLMPNFVCREAIHKGFLIGTVCYTKTNDVAKIEKLIVDKRARNQGVAKQLLKITSEVLKGENIKQLMVSIDAHNLPALNLFGGLGFQKTTKQKQTDDNVLFVKKLV